MRSNLLTIATAAACIGATGALIDRSDRPQPAPAPQAAAARMTVKTAVQAPKPAPAPARAPKPVALQAARAVLSGVGVESGAEKTRVDVALDALGKRVRRQSHPKALRMAFQAYYAYKTENPGKVRKPYLYYVDYGLDNRTPRGYVFDMDKLKVVDGPFNVAHGRGSASPTAGRPTRFSNRQGSNATSLGLYLAQETYGFSGSFSGRRYTSVGLRLQGVSGKYNSSARARGVVAHGAPYVTRDRAGRSEGCPAMEQGRARTLLPKIARGGLVFLFSPLDRTWMQEDRWANASVAKSTSRRG
ncbi:MAG: hypothetical protein AVDCRST_MAG89-3179 [uncultured Gemmatimonadetes bacterium]|uniref:YkuD domain-containing protein n=1 Tax=uncultured Gemmatimonadota bacterium TaxID=203437 RepID=A0A6J4M781_9BACT|nr:MAG: hypothetical protein AVDCRST_MAG89-3179 [uncultured Gemmatimonadota bacterium]